MSTNPAPDSAPTGVTLHPPLPTAGAGCPCGDGVLPTTLLEVHLSLDADPDLPATTVGVGFERRRWRARALARHIVEWVPDFALRPSEMANIPVNRAIERLRRAVRRTFGDGSVPGVAAEILLHAICRELYGSTTVVNKVVFKTADNDVVKGFDAVHCVHASAPAGPLTDAMQSPRLELWLGEAKFYSKIGPALRDAAKSLAEHLDADYLRGEFAVVADKIDDAHPHAEQLRRLLHPNCRLEDVFQRVVLPVFVTYDSAATAGHEAVTSDYLAELDAEALAAVTTMRRHLTSWRTRLAAAGDTAAADLHIDVRLFLLPMADKDRLVEEIDQELASWLR
jgi:hypothetical protein